VWSSFESEARASELPRQAQERERRPLDPLRRVVTLLLPVHPFAPFRTSALFGPISSAEIGTAACGRLQVDLACNGEQGGRYAERTQQRLVPLALASLASGPDRRLLGLFKSSSGTLGIRDGQHEAHSARPSGAERFAYHGLIGDNCFAGALMAAPGVLLRQRLAR